MAKSLKEIILPDLGEGIDGAEVSEVSVAVGDTLSQGDTIVVLESDKASMEIPSDDDGVVKEVLVATGKEVNVGDLLIKLEIEQSSPPKDNKEDKVNFFIKFFALVCVCKYLKPLLVLLLSL